MIKRLLVNAYFAQNVGDDLFLKILFDRYPKEKFYLLTSNQNYKKTFEDYQNVKIIKSLSVKFGKFTYDFFSKSQSLFKYRKFDAFINIGGSIFVEKPGWESGLIKRSVLPKTFNEMNKKSFLIGANFGPFKDELFIKQHKDFFSLFEDVCFRDTYSYEIFNDQEHIRYAPDVVFNLPNANHPISNSKIAGFSIINLENREDLKEHSKNYLKKMEEFIKSYIDIGYKVKLFSFCNKEGDLIAINKIMNNLDHTYQKQIEVVSYSTDLKFFLNEFQACEIIVGTRFHSIILALVFNQKFIPIVYSRKLYHALKDLDMHNRCCFIEDINELQVENEIQKSFDIKVKKSCSLLKAQHQFYKLDNFLNN